MQILTFDEFKKKMEQRQQGAGAATSPAPAATPAPQDNSVQAKSLEETAGMLAAPSFEWISGGNPDMNGNPTFIPGMGPTPAATLDRIHEDLAAQAQDQTMAGPALETIRQGKVLSPEEFKAAQESYAAAHPQAGAQGGAKPAQGKPKDALEETSGILAGQSTEEKPEEKPEEQAPQAEASGTGPAIAASAEGKTPEGASPGTADTEQPKPGSDAFLIQQAQKNALKTQRDGLQEQYNELAANIYGAGKKIGVDYTAEDVEKLNAMEEQIRGLDAQIDAMQRDVSAGQALGRNVMAGLEGAGLAGTQALDWLLGENSAPWWFVKEAAPMFGLDLEGKNPVTKLRQKGEEEVAYWRQKGAEAVEGNDLWEQVGRHTQSISQSAPFLVINLMTLGGAGLAGASTEGLQYLSQLGEASGGFRAVSTMAANGIRALAQNPAAEYSFISTFGQSYADAIADGASETEATLYAVLNGSFNAMIEVGGADEALGGMQNVPKDVRDALLSGDRNFVLKWIKETGQEIGEEEFQNFIEKGFRGIYTDVPVYSTTDENAIFNPNVMLQTAKDTAIDAGLMVGGNIALDAAIENGGSRKSGRTPPAASMPGAAERGAGATVNEEAQRAAIEAALAEAEARMGTSGGTAGVAGATPGSASGTGGTTTGTAANPAAASTGTEDTTASDYLAARANNFGRTGGGVGISAGTQSGAAGSTGGSTGAVAQTPAQQAETIVDALTEAGLVTEAGRQTAAGAVGAAIGANPQTTGSVGAAAGGISTDSVVDALVEAGTITDADRTAAAAAVGAASGRMAAAAGGPGTAAGSVSAQSGTETAEEGETTRRGAQTELNSQQVQTQAGGSVAAASGQTQGSAGSTGSAAGSVTRTGTQTGEQALTQTGEESQTREGIQDQQQEEQQQSEETQQPVQNQQTQEEEQEQRQEQQTQEGQQQEHTEARTPAEQHTEEVLEQTEQRQQGQGGTQTQTPTVSGTALEGVVTDEQLPRLRAVLPDAQAVLTFAEESNFTGDQTVALAEAVGVELPEGTRLPDGRRVTPREAADTSGLRGGVEIHEAPGGPRVAAAGGGADGGGGGPVRGGGGRVTVASGSGGSGGSGGSRGGGGRRGGSGGTKLSQYWTNTLRKMETAAGVPGDVSTPLRYMPVSEAESLARGAAMLTEDEAGTIEKLLDADTWTNTQVDAAHIVAAKLLQQAKESGDWGAYFAWRKVLKSHESAGGQALQATKKWTQNGYDIAMDAVEALDHAEGVSEEERARIRDAIIEAGGSLEEARLSRDLGDIRDLIERLAFQRHTGTFLPKNFRKLLNQIDDFDYLYEYAARQTVSLGEEADYKPPVGDALKTWQVCAQLTRLTTFGRNIFGNVVFGLQDTLTQDGVAVALDMFVSKFTGQRSVGTDAGWFSSAARKASRDAMTRSALEVAGDVDMGGAANRYDVSQGRTFKGSGGAFSRFMSRWEQLLGYSLTTSDRWSRGQIEQAVYEGLVRAGVPDEEARTIAQNTADYRLFQNKGIAYGISKGMFHDIPNLIGVGGTVNRNDIVRGRQGGFGLADLINPYPGVPANLAVKALEYSPANFIKGLCQLRANAKKGTLDAVKQNEAVMNMARGAVGAPLVMALTALFKSGLFRNTNDEDDKDAKAQMNAEGATGIQWNWSATMRALDGGSTEWRDGDDLVSFGWLEPFNAFLGSASMIAEEDDDAARVSLAKKYLWGSLQGVMEMPVFGNIQNAANTFKYSTAENEVDKIVEVLLSLGGDAASGFIPAPVGQLARTRDDVYRDVTADTTWQQILNNIMNSIPGLREQLPVKQDNFGNPKEYSDSELQRFLNNFVLPGAVNELNQTDVGAATEALYRATGDPEVYPDRKAPNSFTASSVKHTLTADEKRRFHATYGGICEAAYGDLFGAEFDGMSDADKADVCKEIKGFASFAAKKEYMQGIGEDYASSTWDKTWARVQNGERLVDVLTDKTVATKTGGSAGRVLQDAGLGKDEAEAMVAAVLAANEAGDKNGTLTQADVYAYYLAHPKDEDYMKALWESMAWSKSWEAYKTSQQKKQK